MAQSEIQEPPEERSSTIIFGCDRDYPPMSYLRGDKPAGLDIEIINRIADAGNFKSEIMVDKWATVLDRLSSGEIDAVSGIIRTEKRKDLFDFSLPYLTESYSVYTKSGSGISSVSELGGRTLAVLDGDAIIETYVIPQGLDEDMILTSSYYTALQLVADGDADYTIAPYTMGQNAVEVLGLEEADPAGRSLLIVEYRFAVKKSRSDLLFLLNESLLSLNNAGSIDEIYDEISFTRQFAKSSTAERTSNFQLLLVTLAALFFGLMSHVIYRNRMQKKLYRLEEDSKFLKMVLENIPIQLSWRNIHGEIQGRSIMWEAAGGPSAAVELSETAALASGKASTEYIEGKTRLTTLPLLGDGDGITGILNLREDCSEQIGLSESIRSLSAKLARKEAELEEYRITDELTGLFNRIYIAGKLQEEIELCSAHGQKFSVLLIDVKIKINAASKSENKKESDILKNTAGSIRKFLRHSDIAGFIGAGMFLIIMPKTGLFEAEKVIGKFADNISSDMDGISINWYPYEFPSGGPEPLHFEVRELLNLKQGTK